VWGTAATVTVGTSSTVYVASMVGATDDAPERARANRTRSVTRWVSPAVAGDVLRVVS
jgi:hypothetical protein